MAANRDGISFSRLDPVRLDPTRLDPARLDTARLDSGRLDSWKEIAAFLGRAERTVKRWENDRGLPIHRVPGGGRSAVFAYSHELLGWLRGGPQERELESEVDEAVPEEVPGEQAPLESAPVETPFVREQPAEAQRSHDYALDRNQLDRNRLDHNRLDHNQLDRKQLERRASDRKMNVPNAPRAQWPLLALTASAVAGLVLLLLSPISLMRVQSRLRAITGRHSSNTEAQELYLKGRYFWDRRTPEDLNQAIDYFTQAIVKDPGEAQAYVGLADCYNLLREFGVMAPGEAYPRALAAAQRAVALDDTSAEAHNSLAFVTFWWSWQAATAEREFRRALQLNPNFVRGHHWYATYLMALHRYPQALEQMEEAQRLDPASTAILADKGYLLWSVGRHAEALTLLKQLETTAPTLSSTHSYLGEIYWDQANYPAAIAEWRRAAELRHDQNGLALADARTQGYEANGLRGLLTAQAVVQKKMVESGSGSAYELAATYAALDDKDDKNDAIATLQIALERRESGLITNNPPMPNLANEAGYKKIEAQVKERLAR